MILGGIKYMSVYMCDNCFNLFDLKYDLAGNNCPKFQCDGTLVQVDEDIAWFIKWINKYLKKNNIPFITSNSCSGHANITNQAYITISPDPNCVDMSTDVQYVKNHYYCLKKIISSVLNNFKCIFSPLVKKFNRNINNLIDVQYNDTSKTIYVTTTCNDDKEFFNPDDFGCLDYIDMYIINNSVFKFFLKDFLNSLKSKYTL